MSPNLRYIGACATRRPGVRANERKNLESAAADQENLENSSSSRILPTVTKGSCPRARRGWQRMNQQRQR
ncbi:hypothetical protein K0M31_017475, partial [Melipona bicolor]